MSLIFHRLVQRDLRIVLRYYEEEGGTLLADQFFTELECLVSEIHQNPSKFHKISDDIRRANMTQFPYHLLFRYHGERVRILILRHHKRNPKFGLNRT